jgi:sugar (pentulose or hexulose) kinase
MSSLLAGLDVGTTNIKACLIDLDGHEVAHGSSPMPWNTVATGAEADPGDVIRAVRSSLHQALTSCPADIILGLGVTGMAEAGVLLDATDQPISPIIAWHDTRGADDASRLAGDLGEEEFSSTTGLPVSATPTIVKLAWLSSHVEHYVDARRWLGVPEYIAFRFGGAPVADLSLACRTGLLDVSARCWWADGVAWIHSGHPLLAELVESGSPIGGVRVDGELLQRLRGAVLTVAGHDHLTAALGAGATKAGDIFDSCGTAEALIAVSRPLSGPEIYSAVRDGLSVSWHVVPPDQALVAAEPTGLFLTRVLDLLGQSGHHDLERLDSHAMAETDIATVRFEEVSGTGLALQPVDAEFRPGQVWRAATEHATTRLQLLIASMERHGAAFDRLVATGGWTQSEAFMAAKRSRFGRLAVPQVAQAGARGAALMSGVAAGVYPTVRDVPITDYTPTTRGAPARIPT